MPRLLTNAVGANDDFLSDALTGTEEGRNEKGKLCGFKSNLAAGTFLLKFLTIGTFKAWSHPELLNRFGMKQFN